MLPFSSHIFPFTIMMELTLQTEQENCQKKCPILVRLNKSFTKSRLHHVFLRRSFVAHSAFTLNKTTLRQDYITVSPSQMSPAVLNRTTNTNLRQQSNLYEYSVRFPRFQILIFCVKARTHHHFVFQQTGELVLTTRKSYLPCL